MHVLGGVRTRREGKVAIDRAFRWELSDPGLEQEISNGALNIDMGRDIPTALCVADWSQRIGGAVDANEPCFWLAEIIGSRTIDVFCKI